MATWKITASRRGESKKIEFPIPKVGEAWRHTPVKPDYQPIYIRISDEDGEKAYGGNSCLFFFSISQDGRIQTTSRNCENIEVLDISFSIRK